jgi:titin
LSGNAGTGTSFTISGRPFGTIVYYRVSTVTISGVGEAATVSITPTTTPSAPRTLTATAVSNGTVSLAWAAPLSDGGSPILSYTLDYCTTSGCTPSTVFDAAIPASATSYTVTGMTNQNGGITFRLRAVTATGTGDGAQVIGRTAPIVSMPESFVATPTAPSNNYGAQIALTWSAPTQLFGQTVIGYRIEQSTDNGSTWAVLRDLYVSNGFQTNGVVPGTLYMFRIAAVTSLGRSYWAQVSATAIGGSPNTTTIASAPVNLTATTDASSSVLLNWTAPTYTGGVALLGYRIRYAATTNSDSDLLSLIDALLPPTATSYRLNGLTNGTNYFVRVNALVSCRTPCRRHRSA